MKYTEEDVLQYIKEEDVKFIRLAFCDVFGKQKNISILSEELPRAFREGIAFDASAVDGFGGEAESDLFLHPEPDTLSLLPWRPEHGKVVRMYCGITYPDGSPFEFDTRSILKNAVKYAAEEGVEFSFGSEMEFYLFRNDDEGSTTKKPYDNAGYMDIAPDDKGENIRREICLTLERMGIHPESSHHEEGPGQNKIDFRYSDALSAADNAMTFRTIVRTVAGRNGLTADFSAKPLSDCPGNGFHVNISVSDNSEKLPYSVAGLLYRISEMTAFFNPTENSYLRLGGQKAPKYISWSKSNRSQLIRIPATSDEHLRAELRSPDPSANPYIVFTLIIYAAMEGIKNKMTLQPARNTNLFNARDDELKGLIQLPDTLDKAKQTAMSSEFIRTCLPEPLVEYMCGCIEHTGD